MEPYLGQIILFAGDYAPINWAVCDGSLLSIQEYQTLYSLLGTQFGGDGVQTFGIPDLRASLPVGYGQGQVNPKAPGGATLTNRPFASKGGAETVTLTQAQIPPHTHPLYASADAAVTQQPQNGLPGSFADGKHVAYFDTPNPVPPGVTITPKQLGNQMITTAGSSQGHANEMPFLAVNYLICVQNGLYPNRA